MWDEDLNQIVYVCDNHTVFEDIDNLMYECANPEIKCYQYIPHDLLDLVSHMRNPSEFQESDIEELSKEVIEYYWVLPNEDLRKEYRDRYSVKNWEDIIEEIDFETLLEIYREFYNLLNKE